MSDYEQVVFISYAWGEDTHEREAIVNQLDQSLQRRGLKIIRDKRDLGYKGSIRNFMERIGEGDCVIVVISDKYLRSKNCMYELVEIAKNKKFAKRIFPIILGDAKIYDGGDRVDYVKYWEMKKVELNKKIRGLQDFSNLNSINEELNDYDRFRDEIDGLTGILKDMNSLSPDILRKSDFQQLYDVLLERMSSVWTTAGQSAPNADSHLKEISSPKKDKKTMDPATLATAATTLLAPYIIKMGEKAVEKIGENLPEKVGQVWQAISNRFKDKPAASEAANDLAKNAEDTDNQEAFTLQLKKALKEDEGFASLLTDLIEQAKSDPSINIGGDGVVANNNSTAVGKIDIGGSVNGNFVIGNNNQVNNK